MGDLVRLILSLLPVLIVFSAAEGGTESPSAVYASDVLAKIEAKQPVYFENCTIVDDLNLSTLKIDEEVHFNHTLFQNAVNCASTTFSNAAYFGYSYFNGPADFTYSNFNGPAHFEFSIFNSEANFWESNFNGYVYFTSSYFNGPVQFTNSYFNGPADFKFSKFNGPVFFTNSNFNRDAIFYYSKFIGPAFFGLSKFNGNTFFSNSEFNVSTFWYCMFNGPAYFEYSNFTGPATFQFSKFNGDSIFRSSKFNALIYFNDSTFKVGSILTNTSFTGPVDFSRSNFYELVDFDLSHFTGPAYFNATKFIGDASFRHTIFKGFASFTDSSFNGSAKFTNSNFNGNTSFIMSTFNKGANFNYINFSKFTYFDDSSLKESRFERVRFNGTLSLTKTRYDKLYIRWYNITNEGKGSLFYDDAAYMSLLKNFKDLGYFEDYDSCYVKYREEHRVQPWPDINSLEQFIRKIIDNLLDIFYGYGKKPLNALGISIFIIIVFGAFWKAIGVGGPDDETKVSSEKACEGWQKPKNILDILVFSATIFLSGTRLFIDPPVVPMMNNIYRPWVKKLFTIERVLGALFLFLLFFAISGVVVRGTS